MTVTALRPQFHPDDRAYMAMRALAATLEELDTLSREDPQALVIYTPEIDRHDSQITLLLTRLRMKRTTTQLCNKFGRTVP